MGKCEATFPTVVKSTFPNIIDHDERLKSVKNVIIFQKCVPFATSIICCFMYVFKYECNMYKYETQTFELDSRSLDK